MKCTQVLLSSVPQLQIGWLEGRRWSREAVWPASLWPWQIDADARDGKYSGAHGGLESGSFSLLVFTWSANRMMTCYDAIVVGGGHNGRPPLRISAGPGGDVVLEQRAVVGGAR